MTIRRQFLGKAASRALWTSADTGETLMIKVVREEHPEELAGGASVQVVTGITFAPVRAGDVIEEAHTRWLVVAVKHTAYGAADPGIRILQLGPELQEIPLA